MQPVFPQEHNSSGQSRYAPPRDEVTLHWQVLKLKTLAFAIYADVIRINTNLIDLGISEMYILYNSGYRMEPILK